MTVPEYLRTRLCPDVIGSFSTYILVSDTDVAYFREIAKRWEKMEEILQACFDANVIGTDALAAARAPLGEKGQDDE